MKPIMYALDAQGTIYIGNRVIARDNPDNPQSGADLAGLVFRANAAGELLAALKALHACHRAFSSAENWTALDDDARAAAEAAIAEATGGQP